MIIIFDSTDEKKWYEKSINLLKKHGIWEDEHDKLWISVLNMIFAEFANVMVEEDLDLDFEEYLYENDVSKVNLYNLFSDSNIEIPLEVINFYMEVNGLKGFPLYGLDDILDNIDEYDITGFFSECLYGFYSNLKSMFIKVLEDEFDSNITNILLYFYCNTENLDFVLKCWDEINEFYELTNFDTNGNYIDEDSNESDTEGLLYDFACTDEECVDSVYSWIANGLNY